VLAAVDLGYSQGPWLHRAASDLPDLRLLQDQYEEIARAVGLTDVSRAAVLEDRTRVRLVGISLSHVVAQTQNEPPKLRAELLG